MSSHPDRVHAESESGDAARELAENPAGKPAAGPEVLGCAASTMMVFDGGRQELRCTLELNGHKVHFDAVFSREWQEWQTGS